MDPLTIMGLVTSGASLLGNVFGKSEAQKRQEQEKRNQESTQRTLAFLAQKRAQTLATNANQIGRQSGSAIASSRSAAMQRAAASGRSGEAESYVLPAEANMAHAGAQALTNSAMDTNRMFDSASINAQMAGLNESLQPLPEQPTAGDYGLPIGTAMMKYGMMSQPNAPVAGPDTGQLGAMPLSSPMKPDISNPEPLAEESLVNPAPEDIVPGRPWKYAPQNTGTQYDPMSMHPYLRARSALTMGGKSLPRGGVFSL